MSIPVPLSPGPLARLASEEPWGTRAAIRAQCPPLRCPGSAPGGAVGRVWLESAEALSPGRDADPGWVTSTACSQRVRSWESWKTTSGSSSAHSCLHMCMCGHTHTQIHPTLSLHASKHRDPPHVPLNTSARLRRHRAPPPPYHPRGSLPSHLLGTHSTPAGL